MEHYTIENICLYAADTNTKVIITASGETPEAAIKVLMDKVGDDLDKFITITTAMHKELTTDAITNFNILVNNSHSYRTVSDFLKHQRDKTWIN